MVMYYGMLCGVVFGYSYDLTKATTLWRGKERAIFYVNKFGFLSQELSGVQGFYSSEYGVIVNEEWSFSAAIKTEGELKGSNDGFVFGFGAQKNLKFMSQPYREILPVDQSLIQQPGFFLWISGDKKQLNFVSTS